MKKELKILVFGNILVKKDNLALRLMPQLQKLFPNTEFIETDSSESLEKYGKNLKIIDVVSEIKEIKTIKIVSEKDFEKLQTTKIYSMHDFDLAYNLKLLKKMNLIDEIEIICLPMNIDERKALKEVSEILQKWAD